MGHERKRMGSRRGRRETDGDPAREPDPRLALVEEHVRRENDHDLDGILATFGEEARYRDGAWGEVHHGRAEVRGYYERLLRALPDLRIDVRRRHVASEAVLLEVVISGTHRGPYRGLPPTGRRVEFPLCAIYDFDDEGRLAAERIYYDRATVLRQLGIFREPDSTLGRVFVALAHPITVARALLGRGRADDPHAGNEETT